MLNNCCNPVTQFYRFYLVRIYYVSRTKMRDDVAEKIMGHYSSKITCIVRLILRLKQEDDNSLETNTENHSAENNVKILIFSQWEPILQAIALALKENDIKHRAKCTPITIEEFKNPKLGITCLLMPFVRGSKGLNLVEATHVFLVEPILNPGEELQAIGRVHRIGQKRKTTVHRFIVNQTIEDNIYNFIMSSSTSSNSDNGMPSKWEFDNISLKDFENLFSLQQNGECD